ncbi:MAG: hypothetical protein ACRCXZ_09575, partial [Patescibacteria group bacterium]
ETTPIRFIDNGNDYFLNDLAVIYDQSENCSNISYACRNTDSSNFLSTYSNESMDNPFQELTFLNS